MSLSIDPNLTGGYMASNLENDSYSMDYCVIGETCPTSLSENVDLNLRFPPTPKPPIYLAGGGGKSVCPFGDYTLVSKTCGQQFYLKFACEFPQEPIRLPDGRFGCFRLTQICINNYYGCDR